MFSKKEGSFQDSDFSDGCIYIYLFLYIDLTCLMDWDVFHIAKCRDCRLLFAQKDNLEMVVNSSICSSHIVMSTERAFSRMH